MNRFVLDNAELWLGDGRSWKGHLVIHQGIIEHLAKGAYQGSLPSRDMEGMALSPGLIDLMVLGGFNKSILRDDPLDIAQAYLRLGVTTCQFCTGTLPWDAMETIREKILAAQKSSSGQAARIQGLYFEGPFQHPHHTGASQAQFALPATSQIVRRIIEGFGDIVTCINVSPGIDGDLAGIRAFREAGMAVSMAHSSADSDRIGKCLEAGTTVLGHAFNNNSGLIGDSGVTQPTLEHVAFLDERIHFIHLICDGVHVHPLFVQLILRCRGVKSVCLVTDAVPRAGCPDGPYRWDDGRMFYKKGNVGRTDEDLLCGSGILLPDHFRNFVRFSNLPPKEAIQTVTANPAACLGIQTDVGRLATGLRADLVGWDRSLNIKRVWKAGLEIEMEPASA